MKKLSIALLFFGTLILLSQDERVSEENSSSQTDTNFLFYSPTDATEELYLNFLFDNAGGERSDEALVALKRITEKFIVAKDWEGAAGMYREFKGDFTPANQKVIDKIIEILLRKTENLIEINLGSGINSEGSEYSPIPTADDETMYFTGFDRDRDNRSEDIYVSQKIEGVWREANRLDESINSDVQGEAPQSISVDGNQLILFGAYKQHLGGGDLYFTNKTADGRWTDVEHFPEPINSKYFDCDAKLSPDGKALLFVSDRPGGIGKFVPYGSDLMGGKTGNTDIYISVKNDDGTWGEPINLGTKINTPYSERKPFLHPDGKSLYFASNGLPGIGRLDLFKVTKLKEDSWTEWGEPVNLGKEVNSIYDDRGAIVSTFGDLAYFASSERGISFGKSDIYTMDMPEALRPEPVATLSGVVTDNDGNYLEADIVWEDLTTGKKLGKVKSDPTNGNYFIVLPLGKNYGLYAEKEGYFPISKNLDLRKVKKIMKYKENFEMFFLADLLGDDLEMSGSGDLIYDAFDLKKDKNKNKIVMNNLFFDYNKSNILQESFAELDRVIFILKNSPIALVEISGHTDSQGSDEYNKSLSEKRAASVVDYLVKKGVAKEKLVAVGYGKEQPIADNDTEEGMQKNRRVELKVLKRLSLSKEGN